MAAVSLCPVCKHAILADAVAPRPFCSQRCRTIDLGSWLEGSYRISEPAEETEDETALEKPQDDEPS